ncbi:unnamed protein product [Closterium sp. Naga37s-1]|nr:unnamed protein product [Closterium sp. Naga37s-1]
MQVRQLVRGTGSEATASAWNGSRTRWAAGTADGALQIWERCDDGAERGPLSLSASWQLGGSGGGEKTAAAAAHVVWAPQEFGGKLAHLGIKTLYPRVALLFPSPFSPACPQQQQQRTWCGRHRSSGESWLWRAGGMHLLWALQQLGTMPSSRPFHFHPSPLAPAAAAAAAAAHVVWAPQEFGGKVAVACRGSSRVHIWGEVGGAGDGEDGRNRARGGNGGDGGSGGSGGGREERNGEERNREGGQDTEMGGGGGGGRGGGAEADQSGAGGGNRWRQVAVVDVGNMLLNSLNGAATNGSAAAAAPSAAAAVLALAFARSTFTDPLLLVAVTSEGRMVVHRCNDCLALSHWLLEADVALFPYADVSMGKELLSRAIIAVHPSTRAFGQSPAVAIATCAAAGSSSSKGDSNTAKVWVRSDRYMHWHAIADLLPATSATTVANQSLPPVTSIAWAPTLDRHASPCPVRL